jgi:hypothetical protein
MKLLRIGVVILFVIISTIFVWMYIDEEVNADKTIPVIKIEDALLEVSLNADNEELLKGVTAYDEKDKDITNKIIVESVSNFIDDGVCKVTYAVCDNDNHVAKKTRKIKYKDYVSPRFSISESTCYSIYERINLVSIISAEDCIDGDISKQIILTSENYTKSVAGVFSVNATVTNKKGDVSTIVLPLIIEDRSLSAPVIELKDYLIYAELGEEIDFEDYIVKATDANENDLTEEVRVESNINFDKEGTYTVHYYVTDEDGLRGHSIMSVVVGN